MWLPKDERKMLVYLRKRLATPDTDEALFAECAKIIPNGGAALSRLIERDLVQITSMGEYNPSQGEQQVTRITLSLQGRDLADKYASSWHYSKLWYQEYLKGHPVWLFMAAILGVAGTLLAQYIYARFLAPS